MTAAPATGDTCHVDLADRWGKLVSATPSGGWLKRSPAIPGLGFCLGTRAQIFTLEPCHPKSLALSKRPRTTLSPSLAERSDGLRLAFRTPGGDQHDQWSLNFRVSLVNGGWNLQEAIDAPMFHTNHFPRSFCPHHAIPRTLVVEERVGGADLGPAAPRPRDERPASAVAGAAVGSGQTTRPRPAQGRGQPAQDAKVRRRPLKKVPCAPR